MRDRLSEFQAAAASSPYAQLVSPIMTERPSDLELGIVSSATTTTDEFLNTISGVNERLERMNKHINDIEHLHRQALSAVNIEEAMKIGRLIDELVARTNGDAQHVSKSLKELTKETEEIKAHITNSDLKIRVNQQSKYAKKFMKLMQSFQAMQTTYQTKYKQQLERQYLIVKPQATREELDKLTHSADGISLLNQQVFSMANRAQAQKTLTEMKERHHDIIAIEKSIKELHQMFLDMSIIIDQQGEIIDKIEHHVTNTFEYTEQAAREVRSAVIRQRGIQKKKWILITIVVVLIALVGLIIWLSIVGNKS